MDGREPFLNSTIQHVKFDPRHLKIGQKFVYRENYLDILEEVPYIFDEFFGTTGGFSNLGAHFIFGFDETKELSLSCYIPPLIEKHGSNLVIMDGIHRDYIAKQAGTTLNAILIDKVGVPFPCSARDWSEIKVKKPRLNVGFFIFAIII